MQYAETLQNTASTLTVNTLRRRTALDDSDILSENLISRLP